MSLVANQPNQDLSRNLFLVYTIVVLSVLLVAILCWIRRSGFVSKSMSAMSSGPGDKIAAFCFGTCTMNREIPGSFERPVQNCAKITSSLKKMHWCSWRRSFTGLEKKTRRSPSRLLLGTCLIPFLREEQTLWFHWLTRLINVPWNCRTSFRFMLTVIPSVCKRHSWKFLILVNQCS